MKRLVIILWLLLASTSFSQLVYHESVKERTTSAHSGTGNYTLDGVDRDPNQRFQDCLSDGDRFTGFADNSNFNGTDREAFLGTWDSATNTISRDVILYSTNSNNAVNWAAGVKEITLDPVAATFAGPVNVKTFGATGDGVTDDTTAIQNALNEGRDGGQTVLFPTGSYKISAITIECNTAIGSTGRISGASNPDVRFLGTAGDNTAVTISAAVGRTIYVPPVSLSGADIQWDDGLPGAVDYAKGVGVRVDGSTKYNTIHVLGASGFSYGLQLKNSGATGITNNRFFLAGMNTNAVCVHLDNDNNGWVNDNQFYGGNLVHKSGGSAVTGVYSIFLDSDNGNSQISNNLFEGITLEEEDPEYHIYCAGGWYNLFLNTRFEVGGDGARIYWASCASSGFNATHNAIMGGWGNWATSVTEDANSAGKNSVNGPYLGWIFKDNVHLGSSGADGTTVGHMSWRCAAETTELSGASTATTTLDIPAHTVIAAVHFHVTEAVDDDSGNDAWDAAFTGGLTTTLVSAGTETLDTKIGAMITGQPTPSSELEVEYTPNDGGNFTDGTIRVRVYYYDIAGRTTPISG